MPSDDMRNKRSANMKTLSCHEEECPVCKGTGEIMVKDTRVAGTWMNVHKSHGKDDVCRCEMSTVARKQKCIRCGGYGTISVRDAA